MKQPNPMTEEMTEDMFEKARDAFFGTTERSPKSSVSSSQLPNHKTKVLTRCP